MPFSADSRINTDHNGREISISLKRSRRARRLRLSVYHDGEVRLVAPWNAPESLIEGFINQRISWISEKVHHFLRNPVSPREMLLRTRDKDHFFFHKDEALRLIESRINHFNDGGRFKVGKITIRNQRSRWGSCSRGGNLSFNYKVIFLTPAERDYIIVHELCHILEFNHSKRFWSLVSEYLPGYAETRRLLRRS